jgi:hypothetical protein
MEGNVPVMDLFPELRGIAPMLPHDEIHYSNMMQIPEYQQQPMNPYIEPSLMQPLWGNQNYVHSWTYGGLHYPINFGYGPQTHFSYGNNDVRMINEKGNMETMDSHPIVKCEKPEQMHSGPTFEFQKYETIAEFQYAEPFGESNFTFDLSSDSSTLDVTRKRQRTQVKAACSNLSLNLVNCRKQCKKCSNERPCERCFKANVPCVEAPIKPRKKKEKSSFLESIIDLF